MSPYEHIPRSIEAGYLDDETESYQYDFDSDSDDAAFSDDIDSAPFIREDSAHDSEEERSALPSERDHQSTQYPPDIDGQPHLPQTGLRSFNTWRSPVSLIGQQLMSSPSSEWSLRSNREYQEEQYDQESTNRMPHHPPPTKTARRATTPCASESNYPREDATMSHRYKTSEESPDRSEANRSRRSYSKLDHRNTVDTLIRIMERGPDGGNDETSRTEGRRYSQSAQNETLGCEYRVW